MSNRQQNDEEMFSEWMENPVTKKFFKFCLYEAHLRRLDVGSGGCARDTAELTTRAYLQKIIEAQVFEFIPQIEVGDLYPREENNDTGSTST